MKYIHLFESNAQYQQKRNNGYKEPWVSYTKETKRVDYNKTEHEKMIEIPLTFEILSDGDIKWKAQDTAYTYTIEYKINDGEWTSITSTTGDGSSISVVSGDVVQFRGDNAAYSSSFVGDCQFNAKGNIMSLIDSTGFTTATTLTDMGAFENLFKDCIGLISAESLILPATTLTWSCYRYMFQGCTSLTTAPELPATALTTECYGSMFHGCTSLTTAPELPTTALANGCYRYMFQRCTSLTTAPQLPATVLADSCYEGMFQGCTSLTTAPELPATTLRILCYHNMFNGCASLNHIKAMFTTTPSSSYTNFWVSGVAETGTFVKNSAATWDVTGPSGIPTGWTVKTASE